MTVDMTTRQPVDYARLLRNVHEDNLSPYCSPIPYHTQDARLPRFQRNPYAETLCFKATSFPLRHYREGSMVVVIETLLACVLPQDSKIHWQCTIALDERDAKRRTFIITLHAASAPGCAPPSATLRHALGLSQLATTDDVAWTLMRSVNALHAIADANVLWVPNDYSSDANTDAITAYLASVHQTDLASRHSMMEGLPCSFIKFAPVGKW